MPAISRDEAVKLLTKEVENNLRPDELLEVHNELFHTEASAEEAAEEDSSPLIERLVDHISSGLEIDEIVDLWGLIFPRHRNVWYDEEEERIHYNEEAEPVSSE